MGLPLAVFALALFVMSLAKVVERALAVVDSSVNFSISSTGCDSDGVANCTFSAGSSFSVAFNLTSLPSSGSYNAYDMEVSWTAGLTGPASPGGFHQTGPGNWPACVTEANTATQTTADAGCGIPFGGASSTYTGALLHMDFTCSSTPGTFTISLNHGDGKTDVVDSADRTHSEAPTPAHEDLTINCQAVPATPTQGPGGNTPTRTATPTATPTPAPLGSPIFSISAPGCNSVSGPPKCTGAIGSSFTVSLNLRTQPPNGWAAYDAEIAYSGVAYVPGSIHQQGAGVWPGCALPTSELGFTPGDFRFGCAGFGSNQRYTGVLATLAFECGSPGPARITLVHGNLNTDLVDASFRLYSDDSDQSLTINCAAPTATPTQGPVGGISLDPGVRGSSGGGSWVARMIAGSAALAFALAGAAWCVKRRRAR